MPLRAKTFKEKQDKVFQRTNGIFELLSEGTSSNSSDSFFKHIPTGKEGFSSIVNIYAGKNPNWLNEKTKSKPKKKKKISFEELKKRLTEKHGNTYEFAEIPDKLNTRCLIRHVETKMCGPTLLVSLLDGSHPNWSPSAKIFSWKASGIEELEKKILEKSNGKYKLIQLAEDGRMKSKSEIQHIPTGQSGPAYLDKILSGKNPEWSPEYKKKRGCSLEFWQKETLEKTKGIYSLLNYTTKDNVILKHSFHQHISGSANLDDVFKGSHPQWSPENTKRWKVPEEIVAQNIKEKTCGKYELVCLGPGGICCKETIVRHVESQISGSMRASSLFRGSHPEWSPEISISRPTNTTPCTLYFALVEVIKSESKFFGQEVLKIGITTKSNVKQRYCGDKTFKFKKELKTKYNVLNACKKEEDLILILKEKFGRPIIGKESWNIKHFKSFCFEIDKFFDF